MHNHLNHIFSNLSKKTAIGLLYSLALVPGLATADVFDDAVDIVIDDVSAGVPGVAGAAQVDVSATDLELEHSGAGGFDVDLNPAGGSDFFVTIVFHAPLDGAPIGSFDWKIEDVEYRDALGNILPSRIIAVELPPGHTNDMPTVATGNTAESISISTGPFSSISSGALNDYVVRLALLGDVNLDGAVNLLDVGPFIDVLLLGTDQPEADIDGNGDVNLLDVDGFIDLVLGE